MLVLSRKTNERIRIGDDVVITVVRVSPNSVRIGIEAPREMSIVRSEIAAPAEAAFSNDTESVTPG